MDKKEKNNITWTKSFRNLNKLLGIKGVIVNNRNLFYLLRLIVLECNNNRGEMV